MDLHPNPKFGPNELTECRNRSKNLINPKKTNFYIEAIPKKSQLRKKLFFEAQKKYGEKFQKFKKFQNFQKIENFSDFEKEFSNI